MIWLPAWALRLLGYAAGEGVREVIEQVREAIRRRRREAAARRRERNTEKEENDHANR